MKQIINIINIVWYMCVPTMVMAPNTIDIDIIPVLEITLNEVIVRDSKKTLEITASDTLLLARLIHSEARGESFEGKLAVGSVVINIAKYHNWSIERTIYDRGRFDGVHHASFHEIPSHESYEAARMVLSGHQTLPYGVMFYHNAKTSTDRKWVRYISKYAYKTIDNHQFCFHPKYFYQSN